MQRTLYTFITILFITSHITGAILKYKSGYATSAVITDTATVYDTLTCTITVVDKENGTREILKRKLDCLIMGSDTLQGERFRCVSFSPEKAAALFARNNDSCRLSYKAGETAGKRHKTGEWQMAGTIAGCLTGIAGAGVMYGVARTSRPTPRVIPDTVQADCFLYGYEQTAKKKAAVTAWRHGLFGMVVTVSLLLILSGNTEYPL